MSSKKQPQLKATFFFHLLRRPYHPSVSKSTSSNQSHEEPGVRTGLPYPPPLSPEFLARAALHPQYLTSGRHKWCMLLPFSGLLLLPSPPSSLGIVSSFWGSRCNPSSYSSALYVVVCVVLLWWDPPIRPLSRPFWAPSPPPFSYFSNNFVFVVVSFRDRAAFPTFFSPIDMIYSLPPM